MSVVRSTVSHAGARPALQAARVERLCDSVAFIHRAALPSSRRSLRPLPFTSRNNLRYRHAVYVRQPHVSAVEPVRELSMIDPEQVKNRRMQIMVRNRLLLCFVPELVGGADRLPASDAGAGHPDGHRARVVVAPDPTLRDR